MSDLSVKPTNQELGLDPDAPTWNTKELQEEFAVKGFAYGTAVVKRKSDGVLGTLEYKHAPRVYYNFVADKEDADA